MSETTFGSPPYSCKKCGTDLKIGENWSPSSAKGNKRVCNNCLAKQQREYYQRRKDTQEAKASRKIAKLRDEERIRRLIHWIQDYNLDFEKTHYIASEIQFGSRNGEDPKEAENRAIQETEKWTYDDVKTRKRPDYLVMAHVLAYHNVIDKFEGDTGATWHIAFHECEYDGYDLDDDRVPIARPGIPRLWRINYIRKKADRDISKGLRFGIVTVKTREIPRRPKTERRIVLCKTDDIFREVDEERRLRHNGENNSLGKLKASMQRSMTENQNIIDLYAELYK